MHAETSASDVGHSVPLCIDLDGTLIRSDTLVEATLDVLKSDPSAALRIPFWLLGGRAAFKQHIAERSTLPADALPYRADLLEWARAEARMRPVFLVTAAHHIIAERVASHLGFFSGVIATETHNLKGPAKAQALVERFGEGGFDYAGDDRADLPVWKHARHAIVAGSKRGIAEQARAQVQVERTFGDAGLRSSPGRAWIRALRLYQWVKNLLVFTAPVASHRVLEPAVLSATILAFVAFGLAASGVYVINDLLDLPSDRRHPRKRKRPFAAGDLPLVSGIVTAPVLFVAAFSLAAHISRAFTITLLVYVALTTAYSFWLKRKMFVDAATLASLYTLRVIAGAAAIGIGLSFWLLALCAYAFLGLALLKRYAELCSVQAEGATTATGRGYRTTDLPVVLAFGVGCSLVATLVTALYIDSPQAQALYAHPEWLWSLVVLMTLGAGRLWSKAGRGHMHDDPIVFVVTDRWSLALIVLAGAAVALAS